MSAENEQPEILYSRARVLVAQPHRTHHAGKQQLRQKHFAELKVWIPGGRVSDEHDDDKQQQQQYQQCATQQLWNRFAYLYNTTNIYTIYS